MKYSLFFVVLFFPFFLLGNSLERGLKKDSLNLGKKMDSHFSKKDSEEFKRLLSLCDEKMMRYLNVLKKRNKNTDLSEIINDYKLFKKNLSQSSNINLANLHIATYIKILNSSEQIFESDKQESGVQKKYGNQNNGNGSSMFKTENTATRSGIMPARCK